jgi:hypothetical protein
VVLLQPEGGGGAAGGFTHHKTKYENPAGEKLGNAVSARAEAATPLKDGVRDGEGPVLPTSGITNDKNKYENPAGEKLGNAVSARAEAATPLEDGVRDGEGPVLLASGITNDKNKYENPAGEQLGNAVSAYAGTATPFKGGVRDGEGSVLPASGITNDIDDSGSSGVDEVFPPVGPGDVAAVVEPGRAEAPSSLFAAEEPWHCPCCTTLNLQSAARCDRCSSPPGDDAAFALFAQQFAGGDLEISANDGETALTHDGFLVGPDGNPLLGAGASGGGLTDRQLCEAKEASLREPLVPWFSQPELLGQHGAATPPPGRKAVPQAVEPPPSAKASGRGQARAARGKPKLSALRVVQGYQPEEAAYLASIRVDKAEQAAKQAVALAESVRVDGERAQRAAAVASCLAAAAAVEARAAARKQRKLEARSEAKAAVAAAAAAVVVAKAASVSASRGAKKARRKSRLGVAAAAARSLPEQPLGSSSFLVDSGAGECFVTFELWEALGSPTFQGHKSLATRRTRRRWLMVLAPCAAKSRTSRGRG